MLETTDRVASNLVTSDTLAEFTAQKLGLVEAAPVAEETSEPEPQVSEEVTDEPKEKKPNPKLERRFSDLTKQREQARAEAQREREAREALETRLKELEAKANPAPQDTNQEPQPEQFADMYEYAKALAEYTADKRLDERDREEKARKAAAEQEGKFRAWADRVNAAKNELPDFEDMVQSSDVRISDPVRDAIIESEHGPKILYYLAENNEYAKKLSEMSVVSAVREIGKIEARFERTKPESKSVNVSKAPAPISPIRGAVNTVDANVDANGVFHGTYQQWKAARQAKRIR
jgi:DNA repair exonuclease SbcCD ATPase subunit